MVIRGYPPSDSISVVEFYFDERKTKERANSQAKFLIGNIKQKEPFLQKPVMKKLNKLVDNSVPRNKNKSPKYAVNVFEKKENLRSFVFIINKLRLHTFL